MFEDSLVESAGVLRARNRWPAVVSVAMQCAVAVLIASLPLLHPELLPMARLTSATLAPPRVPVLPRPITVPHVTARASEMARPDEAVAVVERTAECACDDERATGAAAGAPALNAIDLAGRNGALPQGIGSMAPAGPRVVVGTAAARSSTAMPRVSSGVLAGLLLAPIRPEYPEMARLTRTEGTVVVDAIISKNGSVESAHVVSGPVMLQAAVMAAVRQARYRPFLLNGQPTEVQTTITINFRMGG